MLVYGDVSRREQAGDVLARLEATLARSAVTAGVARHAGLVAALIEAGGLAQGIADQGFLARGEVDDFDSMSDAALALACRIASCLWRSWESGFDDPDMQALRGAERLAAALAEMPLPSTVAIRDPEGFAYYALYPETFGVAARDVPPGRVCVLGVRSIGTALAAMVAAARPEVSFVTTLRPVGHPFARRVRVSDALRVRLRSLADDHRFAIVDEGPGLSGSSIAALIGFLAEIGVSNGRIHILPSHAGEPGPEATDAVRSAWSRVPRHVATFDDVVLRSSRPVHRLLSWCADPVGPAVQPLVEITGGEWRRQSGRHETLWPPVHPWQERRKFLLRSEAGSWLLKFAGLGRMADAKLDLARRLFEAGFTTEPAGLRNGFLVERWHGEARPLVASARPAGLLGRIGSYLGFRGSEGPAPLAAGASVDGLFAMLRHNAVEALGADVAGEIDIWRPHLERLESRRHPVATDNRLHAWEWIEADGRILKTDALDHHAGHDLVGPQDIAWDLAGAAIEFGLSEHECQELAGIVEREAGRSVDADLLRFMLPSYAAFQLGYYAMARAAAGEGEAARLDVAAARYRSALAACLDVHDNLAEGSGTN